VFSVASQHLPEEDLETTEKLEMKTWRMAEIFVFRVKCGQYTSPTWKKTWCKFLSRSIATSPQEPDGKQTYPFRGGVEDFSRAFLDFGNRCYFHHCFSGGNNTTLLGHTKSCEDVISCKNSARLLSAVLGHHETRVPRYVSCSRSPWQQESHAKSAADGHHENKSPPLRQLLTVTTFVYCRCGSAVQELRK